MNHGVIWTSGAESDLLDIFNREENFSEGAGELFVNQTSELLALLRKQPLLGRCWLGSVRKVNIRRSGTGLFYVIESSRLVVIAVLNLRRSPAAIRAEIQGRLPGQAIL